jgi:hypothetical protein
MTTLAFDTYKFARKLESAGIAREQAAGITEAFIDASAEQGNGVATKSDILNLEMRLEQMELRIIIKFGTMLLVASGLLGGAVIFAAKIMIKSI